MSTPADQQVETVTRLLHSIVRGARTWVDSVAFAKLGITFPQSLVLKVVQGSTEPPTASDVAERTSLARSTVSGIVKRLVRDGLLIREPDPSDLRVQRLHAAGAARELLAEADAELRAYMRSHLATFTEEELATFCALLHRLEQSVRTASTAGPA